VAVAFKSKPCKIDAGSAGRVSGLITTPAEPQACYVFAHGAGAPMTHPFMEQVAQGLAERGVATLRYQFAYMEHGSKRPDPPGVAHAVVRAAVAQGSQLAPGVPMFAGGKSFGGRMTSQAQALSPMGDVRGLVFFGFPLHPAGKPSDERGKHLFDVTIPMLFLQGTRDALAELSLLRPVVDRLGKHATLKLFAEADHSFHVPAKTGRKDAEVRSEMLDALAAWAKTIVVRS
jgi:predicted alpha/beta-hydrolase family hydrolase